MGIKAARNTLCYAAGVNHTINYHEQMVVTNQSNQAEHILDHGVSNDLNFVVLLPFVSIHAARGPITSSIVDVYELR